MSQPFETCSECGAPMDGVQRYCVNCGARSGSAPNPSARYFAAATRARRRAASAPASDGPTGTGRAAAVFFFTLLPIAVAVGVMVGRGGSSSDDQALAAALRDAGGLTAAGNSNADSGSAETVSNGPTRLLASDFSLDKGYTVMIRALPISSTDQSAADQAKSDAESKGAKDVGIINPGDYRTTPDQGQQDYILYSGEYRSKADAEKAASGLEKSFPDATVIQVSSASASGGGPDPADGGKVVAQTSHGTVHQVTGMQASPEKVKEDTQTVQQIASETGKDYTDTQQSLPDVTVVGGDPSDAPPLPTGSGD